jgi:hypothetical protein
MNADRKQDFCCRLCGSTEYVANLDYEGVTDGGSVRPRVKDYTCAGCSVKFGNLEKFSFAGKKYSSAEGEGGDQGEKKFRCRHCGCTTYSELYRPSSPHDIIGPGGGRGRPIGYVCDGCSAQFRDPEKFSLTPIKADTGKDVKDGKQ